MHRLERIIEGAISGYVNFRGNPHFDWSDALKTALPAHHGAEDLDLPQPLLEAEDAKVEGWHPHPYLVTAGLANFWCRLCQETAGENHAASEKHCALKSLWHRCVAVLRSMCEWCHLIPTEVGHRDGWCNKSLAKFVLFTACILFTLSS